MEDGLVHACYVDEATIAFHVLILVVMEDGLVRNAETGTRVINLVLILVVMEDGLVLDLIRLF